MMPDEPDLSELTAAAHRVQETYSRELYGRPKPAGTEVALSSRDENPSQDRPCS